MLSEDERGVLVMFCFNHVVATCRDCQRGFKLADTRVDIDGRRRYHYCPSCRLDLTDAIRWHLLTCRAIGLALGERVERSRQRVTDSALLKTASDVLAAESEERAQRAWRRRSPGGR